MWAVVTLRRREGFLVGSMTFHFALQRRPPEFAVIMAANSTDD